MLYFIIILLTVFVVVFLANNYLIHLAFAYNIVDSPDGSLKQHKSPVPCFGGLSIFLGLIITSILYYLLFFNIDIKSFIYLGLFTFLGFIDDIYILTPLYKFIGQFLILLSLSYSCNISLGYSVLFILWGLLLVNAFNLIDVMDGLASSLALVSALFFIIFFVLLNASLQSYIFSILTAFFVSIFAFLLYNKTPASIYLGDSGSHLIGGFFSIVSLFIFKQFYSHSCISSVLVYFILLVGMFTIPLLELFSLIIIRTKYGLPFYKGSPHHFSIYLKNKNWTNNAVVIYSSFVSCVINFLYLFFYFQYISFFTFLIINILIISFWILSIYKKSALLFV